LLIFFFFSLSKVAFFTWSDGVGRANTRQFGGTRPNFGPAKPVLTTSRPGGYGIETGGQGSGRAPPGRSNQAAFAHAQDKWLRSIRSIRSMRAILMATSRVCAFCL